MNGRVFALALALGVLAVMGVEGCAKDMKKAEVVDK